MWRHSFVIADMNGDRIPDIVTPPARLGSETTLHIWLGDGHGQFTRQKLAFTEGGKPKPSFSVDYGGVAVGDIDGDGKLDVVMASHSGGLVALFGQGEGTLRRSCAKGLPGARFLDAGRRVLTDVNGDGRLDIVASLDVYDVESTSRWAPNQMRVYLCDGADRGFTYAPEALIDAALLQLAFPPGTTTATAASTS